MEFSEKIRQYLSNNRIKEIFTKIGIYDENASIEENINTINEYISKELRGKFIGAIAEEKFIRCVDFYAENQDFKRYKDDEYIPEGFIDYNLVLPVKSTNNELRGLRTESDIIGPDGNQYIVKEAEGLKGAVSGMKNKKDGLYNSTIAYALFRYLGQESAEYIPSCEKLPYYYVFSKNFLKPKQKMFKLDDENFMKCQFELDENNNINHSQIMNGIEETIRKQYGTQLTKEQIERLCSKLKLQYAIQETIKNLIVSMDENLGNTSIVITEGINGELEDANISPAYDLDLSFLLGEEILKTDYTNQIFYRTTQQGKTDLKSIIEEFNNIPGYKEKMQEFVAKFQGDYIKEIFDIAYNFSKINAFADKGNIREKFGNFIMRRIALFKEICKEAFERQTSTKNYSTEQLNK